MAPHLAFLTVRSRRDGQAELEAQRAALEAELRQERVPSDLGMPRTLSEAAYAHARKTIDHPGWTGLEPATIRAVREGAQPGDPLPPRERKSFINGVSDTEAIITRGAEPPVAILFSHEHFTGGRFGHLVLLPSNPKAAHASEWLKEEPETGALHRIMQSRPSADDAGVIWTTWRRNR
jgi:hypothetical protein